MPSIPPVNSSIFNFSRLAILRQVGSLPALAFLAGCVVLAAIPLLAFDRLDLPIWGTALAGWGILLWWRFPRYRDLLLVFILLLAGFLVSAEVYFRLRYFGPPGLNVALCRPASHLHPWSLFEYDPATYTGAKPGTVMFKGYPCRVNRDGFRGPDRPYAKPPGTIRLAWAGPSVTMGSGVAEEDLFTTRLEQALDADLRPRGFRVELINVATGGATAGNMLHALANVAARYEPDLIALCLNPTRVKPGDLAWRSRTMQPLDASRWQLITEARYDFFSEFFFTGTLLREWRRDVKQDLVQRMGAWWPGASAPPAEAGAALDAAVVVLDQLRQLADQLQAVPLVYLLKPAWQLTDPAHDEPYRTRLKQEAAKRGILVSDTYEEDYAGYREHQLVVYPGDRHPNALLHRLYARHFYRDMRPVVEEAAARKAR